MGNYLAMLDKSVCLILWVNQITGHIIVVKTIDATRAVDFGTYCLGLLLPFRAVINNMRTQMMYPRLNIHASVATHGHFTSKVKNMSIA